MFICLNAYIRSNAQIDAICDKYTQDILYNKVEHTISYCITTDVVMYMGQSVQRNTINLVPKCFILIRLVP